MKKILLPITSLLFAWSVNSQTLMVPLSQGGQHDGGTILEVDLSNNSYEATAFQGLQETAESVVSHSVEPTWTNSGIYHESTNNSLYIVVKSAARGVGYNSSFSSIFRYDITQNTTHLINRFDGISGERAFGKPVKVGDKLYGVTHRGGEFDMGVIYSVNVNTDEYLVEHSFNGTTDGGQPVCDLFLHNGLLYGAGERVNNADGDLYFSFDPVNSTYTALHMGSLVGQRPISGITIHNNLMYIAFDNTIERLNLSTPQNGTTQYFFAGASNSAIGEEPVSFFYRNSDAHWYVVFNQGGGNGYGSFGRLTYSSSSPIADVFDFQGGDLGTNPRTPLSIGTNGDMYGVTLKSTSADAGILFKFDANGIYSTIHTFDTENDGQLLEAAPVMVGTKLYGITESYGANGCGTIWSYDISNGNIVTEAQLGYPNGKAPVSGINYYEGLETYEVVTFNGGSANKGTVQWFSPSNNEMAKVRDITDSNIEHTISKSFYYNGKTFYLFSLKSNSGAYDSFHFFAELNEDGTLNNVIEIAPSSDLLEKIKGIQSGNIIQEDSLLYGGSNNLLWKVNLNTGSYTTLLEMTPGTEGNTVSRVQKSGDTIFVNTSYGAANSNGALFYHILGSNSAIVMHDITAETEEFNFTINEESVIAYFQKDDAPYFASRQIDDGTNTWTTLATLDSNTNGAKTGSLLQVYNDNLYMITNRAAGNGYGGIVSLNLNDNSLSQILDFDKMTGHYAYNGEMLFQEAPPTTSLVNNITSNTNFLYPNPAQEVISITTKNYEYIQVYTTSGQMIKRYNKSQIINISDLQRGVYIIQIMNGESVIGSEKLVVSK